MNSDQNILIAITDGTQLLRIAMQIPQNIMTGDELTYWQEPENKAKLTALLPIHCSSFGKIVDVEDIFDIKIIKPSA